MEDGVTGSIWTEPEESSVIICAAFGSRAVQHSVGALEDTRRRITNSWSVTGGAFLSGCECVQNGVSAPVGLEAKNRTVGLVLKGDSIKRAVKPSYQEGNGFSWDQS